MLTGFLARLQGVEEEDLGELRGLQLHLHCPAPPRQAFAHLHTVPPWNHKLHSRSLRRRGQRGSCWSWVLVRCQRLTPAAGAGTKSSSMGSGSATSAHIVAFTPRRSWDNVAPVGAFSQARPGYLGEAELELELVGALVPVEDLLVGERDDGKVLGSHGHGHAKLVPLPRPQQSTMGPSRTVVRGRAALHLGHLGSRPALGCGRCKGGLGNTASLHLPRVYAAIERDGQVGDEGLGRQDGRQLSLRRRVLTQIP